MKKGRKLSWVFGVLLVVLIIIFIGYLYKQKILFEPILRDHVTISIGDFNIYLGGTHSPINGALVQVFIGGKVLEGKTDYSGSVTFTNPLFLTSKFDVAAMALDKNYPPVTAVAKDSSDDFELLLKKTASKLIRVEGSVRYRNCPGTVNPAHNVPIYVEAKSTSGRTFFFQGKPSEYGIFEFYVFAKDSDVNPLTYNVYVNGKGAITKEHNPHEVLWGHTSNKEQYALRVVNEDGSTIVINEAKPKLYCPGGDPGPLT